MSANVLLNLVNPVEEMRQKARRVKYFIAFFATCLRTSLRNRGSYISAHVLLILLDELS